MEFWSNRNQNEFFFGIIVRFVGIDGCDNMHASIVGVKYRFHWIFQFFALFFLNSVRFCAVEKLTYEF